MQNKMKSWLERFIRSLYGKGLGKLLEEGSGKLHDATGY